MTGADKAGTTGGTVYLVGTDCGTGVGTSGSGTTGGTKSPCALPARAYSITQRVDAATAKAYDKDEADK